jgi:prepilin-type N-terminal cleavage/methylation domain-containing protein
MPTAGRSGARFPCPGEGQGFTLVEVMVALAILAGSLFVVAQLMVVASRAAEASRETTTATALAAQKIEQLRALAWGMAPDGIAIEDLQSDVTSWPARPSGGPGLSLSPPGTLAGNTAGYVDFLDADGRWVGSGDSPPWGAAFLRRWSVTAADSCAPSGRVIRVAVWRRLPPRAGGAAWSPVVQLEAVRVRRGE